MKLAKATVLGIALFGAFGAGVGTLLGLLKPLVYYVGAPSTLYIVGMLVLLVSLVNYFVYKSQL